MNIVLIGMPGSGKSAIGKRVARALNREFYDMDNVIERESGMEIKEIFHVYGEARFREMETMTAKKLGIYKDAVISTGGGAVKNEKNIQYLKANGVIVFIDRPPEIIAGEVSTKHRPLLKNGRNEIFRLYDERIGLYNKFCDIKVENRGRTREAVNKIVKEVLTYENHGD